MLFLVKIHGFILGLQLMTHQSFYLLFFKVKNAHQCFYVLTNCLKPKDIQLPDQMKQQN